MKNIYVLQLENEGGMNLIGVFSNVKALNKVMKLIYIKYQRDPKNQTYCLAGQQRSFSLPMSHNIVVDFFEEANSYYSNRISTW